MDFFTKTAVGALLAVAATAAPFSSASAADLAAPEPFVVDAMSPIDVAFGVKGTSEYLVRGVRQTRGDPAIQGYVEVQAYDWLYAGVFATNVSFGGPGNSDPSLEADLYGGLRHKFGPLGIDVGYVWVDFEGNTNGFRQFDYGKVYGIVSYDLFDGFTVGANIYYGSDFINLGPTVVHSSAFAKYVVKPLDSMPELGAYVSGTFSKQWTTRDFVKDYLYWDAGAGVTYKAMTLDLRYSDTNLNKNQCLGYIGARGSCGDRYVVSLSFDTSLNKLK